MHKWDGNLFLAANSDLGGLIVTCFALGDIHAIRDTFVCTWLFGMCGYEWLACRTRLQDSQQLTCEALRVMCSMCACFAGQPDRTLKISDVTQNHQHPAGVGAHACLACSMIDTVSWLHTCTWVVSAGAAKLLVLLHHICCPCRCRQAAGQARRQTSEVAI
jgi:hypothetical protein